MGKVINADFEGLVYELDDETKMVNHYRAYASMFVKDNMAYIFQSDQDAKREDMARFLWAAAYFLDSEQRWAEDEYPALDYKGNYILNSLDLA